MFLKESQAPLWIRSENEYINAKHSIVFLVMLSLSSVSVLGKEKEKKKDAKKPILSWRRVSVT